MIIFATLKGLEAREKNAHGLFHTAENPETGEVIQCWQAFMGTPEWEPVRTRYKTDLGKLVHAIPPEGFIGVPSC